MKQIGAGIFVKTPGMSSIKTRLAKTIGAQSALGFYLSSVHCLSVKLQNVASSLQPYWAVAEDAAQDSELWSQFPILLQGEGGLGDKLNVIYSKLLSSHPVAVLLGSDLPHLPEDLFDKLLSYANSSEDHYLIGLSRDGGFYCLAGKVPIQKEIWAKVEYSSASTSSQLIHELSQSRRCEFLEPSFDIDNETDLMELKRILPDLIGKSKRPECFERLRKYFAEKH